MAWRSAPFLLRRIKSGLLGRAGRSTCVDAARRCTEGTHRTGIQPVLVPRVVHGIQPRPGGSVTVSGGDCPGERAPSRRSGRQPDRRHGCPPVTPIGMFGVAREAVACAVRGVRRCRPGGITVALRYILTPFWQAAKPATADHCAALAPWCLAVAILSRDTAWEICCARYGTGHRRGVGLLSDRDSRCLGVRPGTQRARTRG
jgi:hypothetical protein